MKKPLTQAPIYTNATKFRHIADTIKKRIRSGSLPPGSRISSYPELQAEFGAALNTVSRALVELENAGLIHRAPGKGVFVAERAMRTHVIGVSGFAVNDADYWVRLSNGCRDEADAKGYRLAMLKDDAPLDPKKMDGMLIHCDHAGRLLANRPDQLPVVALMMPARHVVSVAPDDFQGTEDATTCLIKLGHKRIAYIGFPQSATVQKRLGGMRAAMYEARIEPNASWIWQPTGHHPDLIESMRLSMHDWVKTQWKQTGCTAILAQNDMTAIGLIQACKELGIDVPGDLSIVGFDGTLESEQSSPKLTTIDAPLATIGAIAVRLLIREIEGDVVEPMSTLLPTRLHVRESTGPAA